MHEITRDNSEGQSRVIEYNEDGQSIGVNASGEDSMTASFSENTGVGGEDSTDASSLENTGVDGEDSNDASSSENTGAGEENSIDAPSLEEATKKRKTRVRTSMHEITCDSSEGQSRVIEYNEDGQSICVNASEEDSTNAPSLEEATKKRKTRGHTSMHEITRDSSESQMRVVEYNEDDQSIGVCESGDDSTDASSENTGIGGEDSIDAPSPEKATKKRRTRGPTSMHEITRDSSEGQRRVIEYNEDGQPIGVNATKLKSFIGTCVRRHVPIVYDNWKLVPLEIKEKLYNLIKGGFVVDPRSKKNILQSAGTAFRQFKYVLTTKYVMPFKDNLVSLKSPPVLYSHIEQEHWNTFVNSRLNEEFERLSQKNQEMRGKNKYNHRLSRKGYANLVEELKKSSTYNETLNGRCILWKSARMNSKGMIVDEQTQEVVTRIDEMLTTQAHKSNITSTTEDVLSLALGTPDHSGRVRGVGNFITPSQYFHKPKPTSRSKVQARQLKAENDFEPEVLNACTALLGLDKGVVSKKSSDKGVVSRKKSLDKRVVSRKKSRVRSTSED